MEFGIVAGDEPINVVRCARNENGFNLAELARRSGLQQMEQQEQEGLVRSLGSPDKASSTMCTRPSARPPAVMSRKAAERVVASVSIRVGSCSS